MEIHSQAVTEFSRYYEEFKNGIYNYILYRVSYNRDIAEDLTADVFVKAYEHFNSYDKTRSFKTWIYTIAHNHLINYLTGNKPTLSLDDTLISDKEAQTQRFDEAFDHQMIMEELTALLSDLPEASRELLTLRYVNDLSNSEIASIMNKDEGAIRTGLSRAIAALRNKYTQHIAKRRNHLSDREFQVIRNDI